MLSELSGYQKVTKTPLASCKCVCVCAPWGSLHRFSPALQDRHSSTPNSAKLLLPGMTLIQSRAPAHCCSHHHCHLHPPLSSSSSHLHSISHAPPMRGVGGRPRRHRPPRLRCRKCPSPPRNHPRPWPSRGHWSSHLLPPFRGSTVRWPRRAAAAEPPVPCRSIHQTGSAQVQTGSQLAKFIQVPEAHVRCQCLPKPIYIIYIRLPRLGNPLVQSSQAIGLQTTLILS